MVFQQSRVKYNFDEWRAERSAQNKTKKVETVRKRKAFLLQPKICTKKLKQFKETNSKGHVTDAESSSEQEHKVNALASGAEEGRDKLR